MARWVLPSSYGRGPWASRRPMSLRPGASPGQAIARVLPSPHHRMSSIETETSLAAFVLRLRPIVSLSDDEFFELCGDTRDLRLERRPRGEGLIMAPTGGATGRRRLRGA